MISVFPMLSQTAHPSRPIGDDTTKHLSNEQDEDEVNHSTDDTNLSDEVDSIIRPEGEASKAPRTSFFIITHAPTIFLFPGKGRFVSDPPPTGFYVAGWRVRCMTFRVKV